MTNFCRLGWTGCGHIHNQIMPATQSVHSRLPLAYMYNHFHHHLCSVNSVTLINQSTTTQWMFRSFHIVRVIYHRSNCMIYRPNKRHMEMCSTLSSLSSYPWALKLRKQPPLVDSKPAVWSAKKIRRKLFLHSKNDSVVGGKLAVSGRWLPKTFRWGKTSTFTELKATRCLWDAHKAVINY